MDSPDALSSVGSRLRQPRHLNKAYAWLRCPHPRQTLGCVYAVAILGLGPMTLLILWLKARQGFPVSTAEWIMGGCSGIFCGLLIHLALRLDGRADRSVGFRGPDRGLTLFMGRLPTCRIPLKRLLEITLKPETSFPGCRRFTVRFKDRIGRTHEWFMLSEDEAAARELIDRVDGLRGS